MLKLSFIALRTSIRHPTYFGRVSFALSNTETQTKPIQLPSCTSSCELCNEYFFIKILIFLVKKVNQIIHIIGKRILHTLFVV